MDIYEFDRHMRELTPHQVKIAEAFYNAGNEWLTRALAARAIGKRRLTPYDINILAMLAERGILEMSTQPTAAPGSDFAYIYRMNDEIALVVQEWTETRERLREEEQVKKMRRPVNLLENHLHTSR